MNRKREMTLKVGLALGIALVLPLVEFSMPINRFTYRAWESLIFWRKDVSLPGTFYPNISLTTEEVGDLAPYSENQVVMTNTWITDANGYRNSNPCENPEIILAGDSMNAGIGLTQEHTISEKIKSKSGRCAYSFSSASVEHALKYSVRWGWKPKYFVFVVTERLITGLDPFPTIENPPKIPWWRFFFQENGMGPAVAFFERMRNSGFSAYRNKHGFLAAADRALFGHKFESAPPEKQKMAFFQKEAALQPFTDEEIKGSADTYASYRDGVEKLGMKFLLVMVPNKESVYPELIPSNLRNTNLPRFYQALNERRVDYVDLFNPYRSGYMQSGKLFHILDDTHWSEEGTEVAANLMVEKLLGRKVTKAEKQEKRGPSSL